VAAPEGSHHSHGACRPPLVSHLVVSKFVRGNMHKLNSIESICSLQYNFLAYLKICPCALVGAPCAMLFHHAQWRQSKFILRGRNFFPHREEGTKPEARRADSGDGVLGEGTASPFPPARGVGSAVSSHSGVRGGTPGKFETWCNLRPQNSLQKRLITCKLLQKC